MFFCRCLSLARLVVPILGVSMLVACAAPPVSDADPYESANRRVHAFNQGLDRAVIRPAARAVAPVAKSPVGTAIGNAADNLSMPSVILNSVLQGRMEDTVHNTWRFALNTTLGIGGIFDPAGAMGLSERDADFGGTLHAWGAGEGAFLMLPVVGPSTERDALGMVVDAVTDPVGHVLPSRERRWATGIKLGSKLVDRARFGDTVDSILHESADSYAQTRLLYLQNRRFELGQEAADDAFIDPYADPYGD